MRNCGWKVRLRNKWELRVFCFWETRTSFLRLNCLDMNHFRRGNRRGWIHYFLARFVICEFLPFLDYISYVDILPEIAVSQLSWALKFHITPSSLLHSLTLLFPSFFPEYQVLPEWKAQLLFVRDILQPNHMWDFITCPLQFSSMKCVFYCVLSIHFLVLDWLILTVHFCFDISFDGQLNSWKIQIQQVT